MRSIVAVLIVAVSCIGTFGLYANESVNQEQIAPIDTFSFKALTALAKTRQGKALITRAEKQLRTNSNTDWGSRGNYFPIKLSPKQRLTNGAVFQKVAQDFAGTGLFLVPTLYQYRVVDDYLAGGFTEILRIPSYNGPKYIYQDYLCPDYGIGRMLMGTGYSILTAGYRDSTYNLLVVTSGLGIENLWMEVGNFDFNSETFFPRLVGIYKRNIDVYRLFASIRKDIATPSGNEVKIAEAMGVYRTGASNSQMHDESGNPISWLQYFLNAADVVGLARPNLDQEAMKR